MKKKGATVKLEEDTIEETNKELQSTLMCKHLSDKSISGEAIKSLMSRIWNIEGRVVMKMIEKNILLCVNSRIAGTWSK